MGDVKQQRPSSAILIAVFVILPGLALASIGAQESDSEPDSYTFYTEAYQCDWARHAEADSIFRQALQPAFESAYNDGVILGWAYMRRALGDEWSRVVTVRYETGGDIFELRRQLRSRIKPEFAGAMSDFLEVCGPHRENIYRATGRP